MPKFKFDHHQLESLSPESKAVEYFDVKTSGLGIRVSVKGTKSFFYRYRFHGKNKRYGIGTFPGISLKLARQRALELKVSVINGVDPQLLKEKKKTPPPKVLLFADIVEIYKQNYLPNLRSATAREYERIICKELMPLFQHKPIEKIERSFTFLATVGSTAPFIGLFGTVWGIMNSFQSIAISRNTSLAIVAPGIAEALFATALGLLAAIPAVIAFNKFSSDSRKYLQKLENFSKRLLSII